MEHCSIVFIFKKELEKSIMVQKKTKTMNKMFFIPKSIIKKSENYIQKKSVWKDVEYEINKIKIELPKWYCEKELKFYK